MTRGSRRARSRHAWLLFITLLLGWSAHGWHHFIDPACDSGRGPAAHECVSCSALHGGVLLGAAVVAAAPERVVERAAFLPSTADAPRAAIRGACTPRAPPAA
jgi:hypothetical protein